MEATNSIERAGQKTRKIQRQLRNVQDLPKPEVLSLLPEVSDVDDIQEEIPGDEA